MAGIDQGGGPRSRAEARSVIEVITAMAVVPVGKGDLRPVPLLVASHWMSLVFWFQVSGYVCVHCAKIQKYQYFKSRQWDNAPNSIEDTSTGPLSDLCHHLCIYWHKRLTSPSILKSESERSLIVQNPLPKCVPAVICLSSLSVNSSEKSILYFFHSPCFHKRHSKVQASPDFTRCIGDNVHLVKLEKIRCTLKGFLQILRNILDFFSNIIIIYKYHWIWIIRIKISMLAVFGSGWSLFCLFITSSHILCLF